MAMSKEEYLKRYLSGSDVSDKKKKKKRKQKPPTKAANIRIFDDDVDLKSMSASDPTKTLEDELPDEEPTVAEVVDERPEEIVKLEAFRQSDRWKQLGADSNKKRHDSSGSDGSPVRKVRHDSDSDASPIRMRHDSDSDQSPARTHTQRHDSSDSDQSPVRRRGGGGSDSDNSPPRRRKAKNDNSDSDPSPPRKSRKTRQDSDSDQSPPRRGKRTSDSDQSPPRRNKKSDRDSDFDLGPVRMGALKSDSDESPPRRRKKRKEDSDESPPRKNNRNKKYAGSDSDATPPRRRKRGESRWSKRTSRSRSPQGEGRSGGKPADNEDERDDRGRRVKTLGGVKAGLSTGREVRKEMEAKKKKEDDMFKKLDVDTLGKNAKTVFRDKGGRRRNMNAEAKEEEEERKKKEKIQAEIQAKYNKWGKGMAQQRVQDSQVEEALHEASKPVARYKDDDDLDELLKSKDREEDPMLEYMQKKKSQVKGRTKQIPRYSGAQPPPNRYRIWPGYRWDGVDRSNGFEKKIFMEKANKRALEDHKYKWSTEDM